MVRTLISKSTDVENGACSSFDRQSGNEVLNLSGNYCMDNASGISSKKFG